ncbi:MAG: RNA-directed DNA polymerase [Deltaproteobacteria bacterium]|nr:RNA-directed DNA polymerase [Deltaproteobacteria bacterium]
MLTVQENSLDWALNHIETYGDTDVFPVPFEYEAIRHDWENVKNFLSNQNILEWTVRPHRMLLAPKSRFGFRVITQLDPLDFLLFAATIYEVSEDLENNRIPVANEVVFSYRINTDDDGQLFDPTVGYRSFLINSRTRLSNEPSFTHVATTDISDFYSRIYHHRLENALRSSTGRASHVSAIMHLLSGWNGTETFGIPVGNAPSRILAEITLSDVDEALLANGISFVRFNDDYRFFAQSHSEAYRNLAFLAEILFRNHGLTLQQQKTLVLTAEEFRDRFLTTPLDRELDSLHDRFDALVAELELEDPYEHIDYDDLSEEQQEIIDSLNLQELLNDEIHGKEEPDLPLVRFILRRLAQLWDSSVIDDLLENLDVLHPAFPDVIRYISKLTFLEEATRHEVGNRLLDIYEDSIISELDYYKMWCLELFANSQSWDQSERFFRLYGSARDQISRRKLILSMARSGQTHWFQSQWRSLLDFPPWTKRAVLAGASCMPPDARRHWYRSINPQLDILERAVAIWARQNPFH